MCESCRLQVVRDSGQSFKSLWNWSELYLSSVSVLLCVCVVKVAGSKLPETVGSRSRARGSGTGQ